MKREIKFRGKRLDNGEWVYGNLLKPNGNCRIVNYEYSSNESCVFTDYHYFDVEEESVGQYTGLKDKNGKEIYDGDIIGGSNGSINGCEWPFQLEVRWDKEYCRFTVPQWRDMDRTHYYKVLGNIHDNPELLEDKR